MVLLCQGAIYYEDENGKAQKEPPQEAVTAVLDATRSGRQEENAEILAISSSDILPYPTTKSTSLEELWTGWEMGDGVSLWAPGVEVGRASGQVLLEVLV